MDFIQNFSFKFGGPHYPKEIAEAPDTRDAMSGLEQGKVEVTDNLNRIHHRIV